MKNHYKTFAMVSTKVFDHEVLPWGEKPNEVSLNASWGVLERSSESPGMFLGAFKGTFNDTFRGHPECLLGLSNRP